MLGKLLPLKRCRAAAFGLALAATASAGTLRVNVLNAGLLPAAVTSGEVLHITYSLTGSGLDVPGGLGGVRIDLLRSGVAVSTLNLYPGDPGTRRGANDVAVDTTGLPGGIYSARITAEGVGLTAPEYFEVSSADDTALLFANPRGVDVNRIPGSPAFGRVYVAEGAGAALSARTTVDGVYALNPDLTPAFPDARVRSADIGALGPWASSANSPFRVTVGPDSEVYVTDCSDPHAGLFVADPDLGTLRSVFAYPAPAGGLRQPSGLVTDASGQAIHGSVSSVWVEGSGASRLFVNTDEDVSPGNSLWQRTLPAGSANTAVPPALVAAPAGANWVQDVVRDADGNSYVVSLTSDDTAKYGPTGAKLATLGANTTGYYGICIDEPTDTILLATNDGRVFQTNRTFTESSALLVGMGADVRDVAFDADRWIYAVNASDRRLRVYAPPGDYTVAGGQAQTGASAITAPVPGDVAPVGPSGINQGKVARYGDGRVDMLDAVLAMRIALGVDTAP